MKIGVTIVHKAAYKALALCVLWVLCATQISAAAEEPRGIFSEYTATDGMAHDNIHDIHIDSRGFVWLCTWSGVSRFDGYTFQNYCTDPKNMPVRHNRFRSVDEDGAGNLWFRTYDDHIYRFDPVSEEFVDVCHSIEQLRGKSYRAGEVICTPSSRYVWIDYQGFGLVGFYSDEQNRLHTTNLMDNPTLGRRTLLMATDEEDNLWVASLGGSLSKVCPRDMSVTRVAEVSDGQEIVALEVSDDAVFYATPTTVRAYAPNGAPIDISTMVAGGGITSLEWDQGRNVLYIGTRSNGLYSLEADGATRHHTKGSIPKGVRSLVADSHGTVWITSEREGITRFDPTRGNYKHFRQQQNTVQFYIDPTSVVIEKNDRVWIKMNHVGFGYYNRERDTIEPFHNDPQRPDWRISNGVATFDIDDRGVIWMSTHYERGLQRIVIENKEENIFTLAPEIHSDSSFLDEVRALLCDGEGNLWVGTKEGHLYCYDRSWSLLHHFDSLPTGEPLGPIYAIEQDSRGALWVGTKGFGLYKLTPAGRGGFSFKTYRHSPSNPNSLASDQIYSIEEDTRGNIWVATYGGAICMLPSGNGDEWVGTRNSFPHYPTEPGEKCRYILCEGPNRMLLGTSEGLIIFDPCEVPESMRFSVSQSDSGDPEALYSSDVLHILKDSKGGIWLSTYGGGLSHIEGYTTEGKPRMKTLTTADGLPGNVVMAATESPDGALWLSTQRGLSRLNPEDGTVTNYTRYDTYEPLVYNEATATIDGRGNVVLGLAGNSLQVVNPIRSIDEGYDYNLRISSLQVKNSDSPQENFHPQRALREGGGRIRLRHDYSMFRINFASLNFRLQDRVNYMYMLEGYDNDWNTTSLSNSAYYSKVPHGHYTFRVKAYVGTPQAAGDEIALPIHIATAPWASWWAWTIYILLAVSLLWLIAHLYLRMAKLRADARMEQDMTEMKLRFFTNISHELRTPLTLIIGGIEDVWRREELSERATNSLGLSHKNAKRMLTLINQLLDFRKVVKNKMELRVERVDVVRLAGEVIDDFRESANEKHIELLFSFSHNHIMLWCDRERIESLLYNLISNAIKFTKNGGQITLTLSQRTSESPTIIKVSDTGIGIAKERLEGIFDRFASYASAVRGEVSGSGIGLALCKEIVELHHGTIAVESKPSQGTTFTTELLPGNSHFTMEQIVFGDTEPSEPQQASALRTTAAPPSGARKVVLAEDNSQMRAFLYNNLIDYYEVIEAVDGVEALEKIHSEQPDIVITDLMMPRMDGIELVEKIRADFEISHLPVIMLTAKQTPEDRIMAMKYGADGYITKPFSMELLLARMDNLLALRRRLFEKISVSSVEGSSAKITPKEVVVTNRDEEFLGELMEWLEENIENSELSIDLLAGHMRLGRTTLYNKIRSLTDKSPVELIKEYRLTKSEMLLRTGQFSVAEVAYKVGFSDPSYFGRCFKEQFKATPGEYLRKLGIKSRK